MVDETLREKKKELIKRYKEKLQIPKRINNLWWIGLLDKYEEHVLEAIKNILVEEVELRDLGLTYEQGVEVWKRFNKVVEKNTGWTEEELTK